MQISRYAAAMTSALALAMAFPIAGFEGGAAALENSRASALFNQIDPREMILPRVVVDVHEEARKIQITPVDRSSKKVGKGSWLNPGRCIRCDAHRLGQSAGQTPRNGKQRRKWHCSGHETTDTDPGIAASKDDYSLETYILSTNHYQIELLTNLDQVPKAGAIVVATFPKPRNGSGFPARVFAIVP